MIHYARFEHNFFFEMPSVPYKQAFAHVSSGKNIYQIRGKKKIRTHFLKPDKVLEFAGKNLKRNDQ